LHTFGNTLSDYIFKVRESKGGLSDREHEV